MHILDWQEDALLINDYTPKVKQMRIVNSDTRGKYAVEDYGLVVELPDTNPEEFDTIIEITLK